MSMRPLLSLALLLLLSACAKHEAVTAQNAAGVQGIARPDSLLAYEHSVSIELAADALGARMAAVRTACLDGSHGRCSLIAFDESTGNYPRGAIKLRLVPEGVEPLVALASREGVLAARSTRAEDLSVAVADTGRQRAQYELQQARLLELAARKDLSVADQLTLARELSTLEAQLQGAERDAAVQQLRLETNLLSLDFSVSAASESRWSTLGEALSGSLDSFVDGLIDAIGTMAEVLPYLIFAFPIALIWWVLWRLITAPLRRARRLQANEPR